MTELEQAQQAEIAHLRQQLAERDQRIALLEQKVDLLIRQLYGRQSEKLDPGQLELLLGCGTPGKAEASAELAGLDAEAETSTSSEPAPNRSKPNRPRIPENLPVQEEVIDPDCVRACPEAWRLIGQEISEQLDYVPGRFFRRRLIRRKYVRRSEPENAPVIAPLPPKLVERGVAAPGLLAHITVSKFGDHLPLYRQEQIYDWRHQIWLPRQTLARWMGDVAEWLKPLYREIAAQMVQSGYLQVDETPVKYLRPGTGQAQQGYLWTYHVPGGDTLYDWHPSRAASCLAHVIPETFTGTIQCDAYSAYRTFAARRGENIRLAGCWAHARRKFFEAQDSAASAAAIVLAEIQKLYRIEASLREVKATAENRFAIRQAQSVPLLEGLRGRLEQWHLERAHLPRSAMGKAISYCLDNWKALLVFAGDGRLEIDNNRVENAIRPTAIGKKNWLFIGRDDTGWRSAVIYTVLASCRNRGIEPYGYLKGVLEILPRATNWQIKNLTPGAWVDGSRYEVRSAA